MQKLKNICALFILAVFLFPLVQGEVHNFSHIDDFHCNSAEAHFHEAEHHCILCDYTNVISFAPDFQHHDIALVELAVLNFIFSDENLQKHIKVFLSLRAPPSLV